MLFKRVNAPVEVIAASNTPLVAIVADIVLAMMATRVVVDALMDRHMAAIVQELVEVECAMHSKEVNVTEEIPVDSVTTLQVPEVEVEETVDTVDHHSDLLVYATPSNEVNANVVMAADLVMMHQAEVEAIDPAVDTVEVELVELVMLSNVVNAIAVMHADSLTKSQLLK